MEILETLRKATEAREKGEEKLAELLETQVKDMAVFEMQNYSDVTAAQANVFVLTAISALPSEIGTKQSTVPPPS